MHGSEATLQTLTAARLFCSGATVTHVYPSGYAAAVGLQGGRSEAGRGMKGSTYGARKAAVIVHNMITVGGSKVSPAKGTTDSYVSS